MSPIIGSFIKGMWWIVPAAIVIGLIKTPWFKGAIGEALVKVSAKLRLPSDTYHSFHNVTLQTPDGTTQIDHILVSIFGIFVIETKNMKGWIFGNPDQANWTQKIYKETFKFQNPLRQNYKHLKALEAMLNLPAKTIHSVIVFIGDSTFKTPMPANVFNGGGYVKHIKSFKDPVFSENEVERITKQIQSGRLVASRATQRAHVEQLKAHHSLSEAKKCPK